MLPLQESHHPDQHPRSPDLPQMQRSLPGNPQIHLLRSLRMQRAQMDWIPIETIRAISRILLPRKRLYR